MPTHRPNGQAFVMHIWDDQAAPLFRSDAERDEGKWSDGWQLINYITHKAGVVLRGFEARCAWLAYVDGF
jgi:hypothetical protein